MSQPPLGTGTGTRSQPRPDPDPRPGRTSPDTGPDTGPHTGPDTSPDTSPDTRPETRQRLVVALTGGPGGETLLRRGAELAGRRAGAELLAVHVDPTRAGLRRADTPAPGALEAQRALCERLGGTLHRVAGDRVAPAVVDFAAGAGASLLVIGLPRRSRWRRPLLGLLGDDVEREIVRLAGERTERSATGDHLDVLVVSTATDDERAEPGERGRRPDYTRPTRRGRHRVLGPVRRLTGWSIAVLLPVLQVLTFTTLGHPGLTTDLLLTVVVTVLAALLGGLGPAVVAAVLDSLLINYFLTPPLHTLAIAGPENAIGLVVGLLVAIAVGSVVHLAARRLQQARHSAAEAEVLSVLAGSVARGEDTVPAVTERLRATFGLDAVSLESRETPDLPWTPVHTAVLPEPSGTPARSGPPRSPGSPTGPAGGSGHSVPLPISEQLRLTIAGPALSAGDRRVLEAFAAQVGTIVERDRLRERTRRAELVEAGDAMRRSLLAAVSHDLRTPLASITAGISSLRQPDVAFAPEDQQALLAMVADSGRRLERLIDNLLDLSRLQAGIATPALRTVSVEEIVWPALPPDADDPAAPVTVAMAEGLGVVRTDPGLLERALANVIENARKYGGGPVQVEVELIGDEPRRLELAVVDHGPGVPAGLRPAMFEPFQQVGDRRPGGVGLGLAVAQGFVTALGGRLDADDTPGGGLTMTISVPVEAP